MLFRALAVLVLCSFLAGGSLFAWRSRPAPVAWATPVPCLPSAHPSAPVAPPSAPAEELPWVNPNVMPGLLRLETTVMLGRPVRELRASEDGSRIAALLTDGTLWLLRREGATLVRERVVARAIEGVDMAPSGMALATTDEGHELTRWTLPVQGEPEARFVTKDAWGPSFRDGHLRWTGPREQRLRLDERGEAVLDTQQTDDAAAELDADTLANLPDGFDGAMSIALVGRLALGALGNGELVLADAEHGASIAVVPMQRGPINALTSRGSWLFSGGEDGALRLWSVAPSDAPSATRVVPSTRRDEHDPLLVFGAWDDEPTGRRIIAARSEHETRLFTPQRPEGVRVATEAVVPFFRGGWVFSPRYSSRLLIHTDDGAREASLDLRSIGNVGDIEVGAEGRHVLVQGMERTVVVDRTDARRPSVHAIDGDVRNIEASPSGAWFAAAMRDNLVRVWRPGHEEVTRAHSFEEAGTLEFDAQDSVLIVGAEDEAHAWHLASDRVVSLTMPAGGRLHDVRVSPDGAHATGAFTDGATVLWETNSGRIVRRFCCQRSVAYYAEVSPDGTLVLSYSRAGVLSIWSVATGAELAHWPTPSGLDQHPHFSSDSSSVRWYSDDSRVTWPLRSLVPPPR